MQQEQEAGKVVSEPCRKHGMSSATFYAWRTNYGAIYASEACQSKVLEEENVKLKRLYADAMLDNAGLTDLLSKHGDTRPGQALRRCRQSARLRELADRRQRSGYRRLHVLLRGEG